VNLSRKSREVFLGSPFEQDPVHNHL
jgi:hypothetical protein